MSLSVTIKTIPHKSQRYPTTGDWGWLATDTSDPNAEPTLFVTVSDMGSWRYEVLVAIHEVIEAYICKWQGIQEFEVNEFDVAFEKRRPRGNIDEPGDESTAPYYFAHQIATGVERTLAAILGVDWHQYEAANNALYEQDKEKV
jgi:hypothetical protein